MSQYKIHILVCAGTGCQSSQSGLIYELLQDELKRIHEASRKTCLFVTHDIREALKLGTKVMIMNQGRLLQYGTPAEILKQPAGDFVRQLLETLHRDTSYLMDGAGI